METNELTSSEPLQSRQEREREREFILDTYTCARKRINMENGEKTRAGFHRANER